MAKIKTANQKGKYFDAEAKTDVIDYILNPYKATHGFVGGIGVNPECPAESMAVVSETFGKSNGVQLRHYIVSFSQDELTDPRKANAIAQQLTAYIGQEFQAVYAVHENKAYLHVHIVVNTVSFVDGHRWRGSKAEFYHLIDAMKQILHGFNINRLEYIPTKH